MPCSVFVGYLSFLLESHCLRLGAGIFWCLGLGFEHFCCRLVVYFVL